GAFHHFGDDRTLRARQAERVREILIEVVDLHAEPAAPHDTVLAQLRNDVARLAGRDRKPDADAAAGRRVNRRVHADDLTAHVEHGAARVALIDRGVDLDEVV